MAIEILRTSNIIPVLFLKYMQTRDGEKTNEQTGRTTDDFIMLKSCFPNGDIMSEGTSPGDTALSEKTIASYKATFIHLKGEMQKYTGKLYIYLTILFLTPVFNVLTTNELSVYL